MTTPRDICNQALKDAGILGVGQTALAEDTNDAFVLLKQMIAQWQRQRWLVYQLVTMSLTMTGAQSYTIGPNGNFNVAARPARIESAFVRQTVQSQPNQVDYPLKPILAREQYNLISLKSLSTFPEWLFYDTAYPLGVLYPWPVPNANIYALHITIQVLLQRFASLSDAIVLPDEYEAAMRFNLAQTLRPLYQLPRDDQLDDLAKNALNVVRGANTQIAPLQVPSELIRPGQYNIFSDRTW